MASTTKAELERKYGIPVYTRWNLVPSNLHTRAWFAENGVTISKNEKPSAVKGGGQKFGKPRISFLFDERDYLCEARLKELAIQRRPII